MHLNRRWLWSVALGAAILVPAAGGFASEECVTHHSWECSDDPNNTCKGTFDNTNPYVESASVPHELSQVIRFSPVVSGTQKLRMSGIAAPVGAPRFIFPGSSSASQSCSGIMPP